MTSHLLSALGRRTQQPPISWLMATALAHPRWISLAAGFTDHASLPVQETRQIFEQLLSSSKIGPAALQYGSTIGDPVLRQLTTERLRSLDGRSGDSAELSSERMIITNGSQQLLYMVTEALCDPGDLVLVEDPSYFVYLGILQSHGVRVRGVRLEKDGFELAHLEKVLDELKRASQLPKLKLLYLVSYYQNPSGVTTSFEKKATALDLLRRCERAAGHRLYLLEDAAYREMRFRGDEIKSALALPRASERVIYAGTYSKPFATGARVGFGILPKAIFSPVARIKGNHDFGSSNLLQQLLARALGSELYQSHLELLRNRYAQKAKITRKALQQHFPASVQWCEPEGGLYFWPRLPQPLTSGINSRLFREAFRQEVLYVPGQLCYANDPSRRKPNNEMRLSFGAATEKNIWIGIERLGRVLRKLIG